MSEDTAPAAEETTPAAVEAEAAAVEATADAGADTSANDGAVDTGRRIDPSKLSTAPKTRLRRKGKDDKAPKADKPEAKAAEADAPVDAKSEEAEKATPPAANPKSDRRTQKSGGDRGGKGRGRGRGGRDGKGRGRDNNDDKGRYVDDAPMKGDARPKDPTKLPTLPPESKESLNTFDMSGDFAAMLEAAGPVQMNHLRLGDEVQAKIIRIAGENTFLEVGVGQEAWMHSSELQDNDGNFTQEVGNTVRCFLVGNKDGMQLSRKLGRHGVDVGMLEEAARNQIPVEGKVTGVNKGGLEVEIGGGRGFCPIGQADINYIEDSKTFIGQTLFFLVKEVKENGKNVLLSRRALLEKERAEAKAETMKTLEVGAVVEGTVSRIAEFGVFVDLGGVDGMIPISELSWGHVKDAHEVVQDGQKVRVEILRIEPDAKRSGRTGQDEWRIGLSKKAVDQDPWDEHKGQLQVGASLEGKVTRLKDFGAFVELFVGVEGLVHISEISHERIQHPSEVISEDEAVTVTILDVNFDDKRVSLSLRGSRGKGDAGDLGARSAGKNDAGAAGIARGARVKGTVDRIEKYGVFLALESGQNALLPAQETGTPRGTDLRRTFPLGTELDVLVIDVDDRGRIRVSKTALEQADERAQIEQYTQSQSKGGGGGLGSLGDLLKDFKL